MTNILFNENTCVSLSNVIDLLHEVHDALVDNDYKYEAKLVSHHIETLKSPEIELRLNIEGVNEILKELAQGFCRKKVSCHSSVHTIK